MSRFLKLKIVIFTAALTMSCLSHANDVVVLVPGFFNSFAPEYFSHDIVGSFKNKGFKVYVAQGLNPIGTIAENGSRLEKVLEQIEAAEGSKVTFNVIAHSAGGFYTLWVANRQKFDIKNIFTVSTPYKGVEFVQTWINQSFLFRELSELAYLDGLVELTATGVKNFLSSIRVAPTTTLYSFGGYQTSGIDFTNARNLSWPLRITNFYTSEKSDGIVGYSSALALGEIKTTDNKTAKQFRDPNFFLALEHWEQVLDGRSFLMLGVLNPNYIRNEQIRFYTGLADLLLKVK